MRRICEKELRENPVSPIHKPHKHVMERGMKEGVTFNKFLGLANNSAVTLILRDLYFSSEDTKQLLPTSNYLLWFLKIYSSRFLKAETKKAEVNLPRK